MKKCFEHIYFPCECLYVNFSPLLNVSYWLTFILISLFLVNWLLLTFAVFGEYSTSRCCVFDYISGFRLISVSLIVHVFSGRNEIFRWPDSNSMEEQIVLIDKIVMEQLKVVPSKQDPEQFISNVRTCHYEPSINEKFAEWYASYLKIYERKMSDAWKIELLLRKFRPQKHSEYIRYLDPKKPTDISFYENIESWSSTLHVAIQPQTPAPSLHH